METVAILLQERSIRGVYVLNVAFSSYKYRRSCHVLNVAFSSYKYRRSCHVLEYCLD